MILFAAAFMLVLSACAWTQRFGDAGRSGYNPLGGIDEASASSLLELWRSAGLLSYQGLLDGKYAYGVRANDGFTARGGGVRQRRR